MSKKLTWRVLAGATALSALALGACGSSTTASGPQATPSDTAGSAKPTYRFGPADDTNVQDGGKVVIGLEAETDTLDPSRIPFAASGHMVASAVFDPLETVDENGRPKPYLATSIDPSADYRTWTISLREGVLFHDGTPFDADALKLNLEAYKASSVTGLGFQFVGPVTVVDPLHVKVELTQPWVSFPLVFLSQAGYMLAPSMLSSTDPANTPPVGTGPFVFAGRNKNEYWKFKKNPNYWQKGLPHLSDIEFRPMPDEVERAAALDHADVDMIHTSKPDQVLALRESQYKRVEYDNGEKDFIVLNTEQAPFDNLTARQAVAYATDYEYWRKTMMKGVKPKATGPLSPGQAGYEEDTGFPTFDLAKATQLVNDYEQQTGKPLEFEYLAREDASNMADAQELKAMWEKAGMKVTLKGYPQIQLIAHVATGGYQLSEWRLFGDASPDVVTVWLRSTSVIAPPGVSLNFPRFKDAVVDQNVDKALATTDEATKAEALKAISHRLAEQIPYVWLGRADWSLAANPRVNGMYAAANGSVQTLGPKTWIANLWLSS